ncbi:tripartite tricarboxylate transporter permease [Chloroflexi bacterium TSY]|nr:tripartite tricarboxylate transporter permease [Chloroflexi bacterium TSY]
MDALLAGLDQLLQVQVLVALFTGAIMGVVIGATPGVGPAVAIAILLPVTFAMEPLTGLTLLLGIYAASMYGGAIPSILINTPGTVVNVLTTYDGYPLTQRGEGRRALSLAYSASFVGGVSSVIVLILLALPLANFAKRFGSAEFAMAALFAMVVVVLAHREKAIAAAMTLGLGLFFATIGIERAFTTQRYTFDQPWLLAGIPLIPMVLGLFAMSQGLMLLIDKNETPQMPKLKSSAFAGLVEIFKYPRVLFSSAGFGVAMDILPGVGEFMAQFFSYSLAQRLSTNPEEFGNGAPEGIIASEAANNAVPASAMIPLLALGIPGEALTAMMLSVFYVHNVVPGPALFETRPEFVMGLFLSLLITNFVIVGFLMLTTRWLVNITVVDPRFIGIVVLTLSLIGTYTSGYKLSDPLIALFFAFLGYVMNRHDIPSVPIVLGPIFEARFRQALGGANGDLSIFLVRPISLMLILITIVVVITFIISQQRQIRIPESQTPH